MKKPLVLALMAAVTVAFIAGASALLLNETQDKFLKALTEKNILTGEQAGQLVAQADEMNARVKQDPGEFQRLLIGIASRIQKVPETTGGVEEKAILQPEAESEPSE